MKPVRRLTSKLTSFQIRAAVWILLPLVVLAVPLVPMMQAVHVASAAAAVYFVLMGVWFGARCPRLSVPVRIISILAGINAAVFGIQGALALHSVAVSGMARLDIVFYKFYGGLFSSLGHEIMTAFLGSVISADPVFLNGLGVFVAAAMTGVVLMVIFFLLGLLFARGYLYGRRIGDER